MLKKVVLGSTWGILSYFCLKRGILNDFVHEEFLSLP